MYACSSSCIQSATGKFARSVGSYQYEKMNIINTKCYVLWKKVRKAREDQYDFSSADIGIVHIGTTRKKLKDTSRQTLPSITELPETTNPGMDSLTEAPETLDHELNSLTSEIKIPETMHCWLDQQDENLSMNTVSVHFHSAFSALSSEGPLKCLQ